MSDKKLTDYVNSELQKGKNIGEIKDVLVSRGWPENEIDDALSEAQSSKQPKTKEGKTEKPKSEKGNGGHKKIYIAGAVIVLLILFVTVCYIITLAPIPVPPPNNPPGPPAVTVLSVSPALLSSNAGGTFTVDVQVKDASDLYGFQFNVEYDPSVLEFASAQEGNFLNNNGANKTFCVEHKANTPGFVKNIACSRLGQGSVEGNGVLEKLAFKAKAAGKSRITLSNVQLANSKAEKIDSTSSGSEVSVS